MLDVHVLVNSQEYNVPAGVIRFRDFEKASGIKVLKYALSTSDAAQGTEDYKVAVATKALPSSFRQDMQLEIGLTRARLQAVQTTVTLRCEKLQ